ncbi:MAG: transglutaminase-like domain-containing protein [Thermoplasmatota archaeon]
MKAKKLNFDNDEEEWDDWEEEEEEDDIIDEEEEEEEDKELEAEEEDKKRKKKTPRSSPGRGKQYGKKALIWTFRGLVVVLILMLLFAPWPPFTTIREETGINSLKNLMRPYMSFPEWANVTMSLMYNLEISRGSVDELEIHVAPPFDIPFTKNGSEKPYVIQDVLDVEFSPPNTIPLMDYQREMNQVSGWKIQDERGSFRFKVTYHMTLHAHQWEISPEESGTVEEIPDYYTERYIDKHWMVDLDNDGNPDRDSAGRELYRYDPTDPEIIRIAEELTIGKVTVIEKVKAIYDYMQENFEYTTQTQREQDKSVYGDYPKWATGCLADGYGDCDDQSLLMASLCRAVGIPAWLEIGYLYDPMGNPPSWGGHGWFNVVIPVKDRNGNLLDEPVRAPIDPVNHEFLFRDPYRITDWIDDGGYRDVGEDDPVFNLDYYYNYFSVKRPPEVIVDIEASQEAEKYEKHGSIKIYSDKKLTDADLPGSQQQLPVLSPLLVLVPVSLLFIAVPIRRSMIKRE